MFIRTLTIYSFKMKTKILILTFLTVAHYCVKVNSEPEVLLHQGNLRGTYIKTLAGKTISAFTGIPYAKPPVGELRFKPPVSLNQWPGIFYANKTDVTCIQSFYFTDDHVVGTEDCLVLNIYTPQLDNFDSAELPVMVFIHGGGFMAGSGNINTYGPKLLLDKEVVLVTINYRVGAFGFLTTGDLVVPGNNGLKDQHLALSWIKENIAKFGGNPNKITIFGQSAGAASVHLQMMNPKNKDIVHGAIIQSGSGTSIWGVQNELKSVNNTIKLAEHFDCPIYSSDVMIDCLRKVDAIKISEADKLFKKFIVYPFFPYGPVVEPYHEEAFLSEHPFDILKSGKALDIPYMLGSTQNDAGLFTPEIYGEIYAEEFFAKLDELLPIVFNFEDNENKDQITKTLKKYYFRNKKFNEVTLQEVIDIFTDGLIGLSIYLAGSLQASYYSNPGYLYVFDYLGKHNFLDCAKNSPPYLWEFGVVHCDDLVYLLSCDGITSVPQEDEHMYDLMLTLWTNFAKTGNPTPEINSPITSKWKPLHKSLKEHYYIGSGKVHMRKNEFTNRMKLWGHFVKKYDYIVKDEL